MKKHLLLLLLLLLAVSSVNYAQFKMGLTPVTGINLNLHSGSDLNKSGNGFGLLVGAQADMQFSPSIGMIAGFIFYDNRSASFSESGVNQGYQYESDLDVSLAYFQLEALLKYKLPSKFYFVFGPVLGFNMDAESEVTIKYSQFNQTYNNKSSIKDTETRFELKAGAGYEIPVSENIDIIPQLTFGYGLTNVVEDVKWKIMTFQTQVGVRFSLL